VSDEDKGGEQPDWPDTLVVPDDPAELHADALALRRERAAARRRARWRRLTGGDRLRGYGISVPVVIAATLAVAGFGALLVLLGPRGSQQTAAPAPIGTSPTALPGRAGGLLPPVTLSRPDGDSVASSALTADAAILLVPAGCDCAATVDVTTDLAVRAGLTAYVIEPTTAAAGSVDIGATQQVVALADVTGRLLDTYGSDGLAPTLLLLDGRSAVRLVEAGLTSQQAQTAFATTTPTG
jgi:hypothetical protein